MRSPAGASASLVTINSLVSMAVLTLQKNLRHTKTFGCIVKNIWLHTRWCTIAIRFNGVPKGRWGGVKASGKETSRQGAMYCRMKWSVARKDASERMGLCPLGWSDRPSWLLFSLSACTHSTWAISFFPSDQKIRGTKKFFLGGGGVYAPAPLPPSSATGCK